MLDLLIRDAQLIDGTGAPRRRGDVGVRNGRIVSLGPCDERAKSTIDAAGAVVSPGFVDVHTHYDVQVLWEPSLAPSSLHGVTSAIGGNCGFSVAPINRTTAGYMLSMLARVEGMPLNSLEAASDWDWESTAEYLDRLEGKLAPNVGFMVGHSAIRRVVMGEASIERPSTPDELHAMKMLLREGLRAGGMGFSSSLARTHTDGDGAPVPSRHASKEELIELASVCGEFDGTSLELVPQAGPDPFPPPLRELMVQMSVAARRTLNWNILHAGAHNVDEVEERLSLGDQARSAGGRIVGLLMPMPITLVLNFSTGAVLELIPGWDEAMVQPHAQKLALLSNRESREHLRAQAENAGQLSHFAHWGDYVILECFTPETGRYQGVKVEEIAHEQGKHPFDALVDLALADDLQTTFGYPTKADTQEDWEVREGVLRDPRVVIGASDAGAHLDMIDTFSYTTHLLEYGVRRHKVLSLEEAIRLITQVPALLYGLDDRGILREGAWADLVVFDEDTVGPGEVHIRRDLPGGARRLFAESKGIENVVVGGEPIVEHGRETGRTPGRVLRSGVASSTGGS